MSERTPEEIARRLSPAMRAALELRYPAQIGYSPTWFALRKRGLFYANKWTDLGRRVAVIIRQGQADE
jgi:hypothetical protein